MINSNVPLDLKAENGTPYWRTRGADTWTPFRDGTATAAQVLSGYTFSNATSLNLTGTMQNRGNWSSSPTTSTKITIPAGYHNGRGYVDTSKVYTAGYNAAGGDVKHTLVVSVNLANYAQYPQAVIVIKDNSTGGTVCSFSPFWTTDSSGYNTHSTGRNTTTQSTTFVI